MQQEISKIFRLHLDILIIVENGLRQPLLFLVRTKTLSLQNEGSAYRIKKTISVGKLNLYLPGLS